MGIINKLKYMGFRMVLVLLYYGASNNIIQIFVFSSTISTDI